MALLLRRVWGASVGLRGRRSMHDGFASLNIYKDAAKAPKEMSDDEYPTWLWRLTDQEATLTELTRKVEGHYAAGGYDAVFDKMGHDELIRLFRLANKDRIRENNQLRKGGNL